MHASVKYQGTINETQAFIMGQLFLRGSLRFAQINTENVPSDQFSYHLRQLIKYGLVEKSADNLYSLSVMGRSRAILLDTKANKFIEQGFVACRVILARSLGDKTEYLMQRRTKVPYKGYIGEPGGKILFGEDVLTAARRNMLAETGLQCNMMLRGLVHFKDKYLGRIVQDKYFFLASASNPRGELLAQGETGENIWMTLRELASNPKTYQGVTNMIALSAGPAFGFIEQTHVVEEY
jgi:ADP-ribose pyrophosphatase YjhB (NUDIX family)